MSVHLTDPELDLVLAAADLLMPDEGLLPSVESAGLRDTYLDAALVARPDCLEPLREFARSAADAGVGPALDHARSTRGEVWDVLTTILPGAYFLSGDVRRRLGYEGQTADRIDPDAAPDYQEFLGVVVERGLVYRPTPPPGATQSPARQP